MSPTLLNALIHNIRLEAQGIVSVELRPAAPGETFPAFDPGAHIDLHLTDELVRSYSLLNASTEGQRYVVAVLLDKNSRGGSRFVHERLHVGRTLKIGAPRNNFHLQAQARHSVLVAGGIGVTPLYCMLQRLHALGRSVDVIYCARSRAEAAFLQEIQAYAGEQVRVTCHFDVEQGGPPDLKELLRDQPLDSQLYCCGPAPMLDAFETTCAFLGFAGTHIERFAAAAQTATTAAHSYTLVLKKSRKTMIGWSGEPVLDCLLAAGELPDHSCREGICGSCETKIVSGDVEHLDSILTPAEKLANKSMMLCVSRCAGSRLELDL